MKYELMVILNPKQTDKEIEKELKEVKKTLTDNGFETVDEDIWGVRELAYKIKGHAKGYYVVLNLTGEPEGALEVHRDLTLQPSVLRYLLIKVADNYVMMRYEQMGAAKVAKLSSPAEELNKKVRRKKKTEEVVSTQENSEKLDEKLQAIIEDKDIDL